MSVDKVGKSTAPIAPAIGKGPAPAAPSSGPGSFRDTADEALALQIEQDLFSASAGAKDPQKEALESIDDIAARNSVNFVKRKDERPGSERHS
jgi:hypothetical protein